MRQEYSTSYTDLLHGPLPKSCPSLLVVLVGVERVPQPEPHSCRPANVACLRERGVACLRERGVACLRERGDQTILSPCRTKTKSKHHTRAISMISFHDCRPTNVAYIRESSLFVHISVKNKIYAYVRESSLFVCAREKARPRGRKGMREERESGSTLAVAKIKLLVCVQLCMCVCVCKKGERG